jgi:hypothetical protein
LPSYYRRCFAAAFLFLFCSGCGTHGALNKSWQATTQFHAQLDAEQYSAIYAKTDEGFRAASTEKDLVDLLAAVHRKLGNVQSTKQTGFFINWKTSGASVRLIYQTTFQNGDAQETFIWHVTGGKAYLFNYNINSNALITQ